MRYQVSRMPLALTLLLLSSCGGGGDSSTPATTTPPANSAPTAVISVTKSTGYAPLVVELDGSSSTDSDGSISTYTWHTGDGNSYAGSTISHTYTTLGTFSASLTVTDDDGASSQTSITIKVHAQAAGFYWGYSLSGVALGDNIDIQVGSDHRVYGIGYDEFDFTSVYGGTASVSGNSMSADLLAETYDPYVFSDGSQLGDISIDATISPRDWVTVTYTGVGENGSVDLIYDLELNQPKSLSDLEGSWSWSDGLGYVELMIVDANGAFTASDTDGCTYYGQFTPMDPALNEFDIEYDLTCPAGINRAGNGIRKGLAHIYDSIFITSIWLEWGVSFLEGPLVGRTGYWSLMRPQPGAIAPSNMDKTRPPKSRVERRMR